MDPWLRDLFGGDEGPVLDPGLPAAITSNAIEQLVTHQCYESAIANRLFRILRELERWQRMRQGEQLPAPAAVDVNLHTDTGIVDSVAAVPAEISIVDLVDAKTETVESVPSALGQPKSLSRDEE